MPKHQDEPESVARMDQWLQTACDVLDLNPELVDKSSDALLEMVRVIAHGPSRPAAPLSAFLVGYAAGKTGAEPAEMAKRLEAAAQDWQPQGN